MENNSEGLPNSISADFQAPQRQWKQRKVISINFTNLSEAQTGKENRGDNRPSEQIHRNDPLGAADVRICTGRLTCVARITEVLLTN